jgi:hypothetical protein
MFLVRSVGDSQGHINRSTVHDTDRDTKGTGSDSKIAMMIVLTAVYYATVQWVGKALCRIQFTHGGVNLHPNAKSVKINSVLYRHDQRESQVRRCASGSMKIWRTALTFPVQTGGVLP